MGAFDVRYLGPSKAFKAFFAVDVRNKRTSTAPGVLAKRSF